ncbi:hypothetical protein F5Y10DRAFT_201880 [Nemania abortiva]|nr:hypothetical protein F5Y10DRAFT_201880 [Nemania abortiva]
MAELAFIGLASNILQFLQIGMRVAAGAYELYRSGSGTTTMNARLEADTIELRSLMGQLRSSSLSSNTNTSRTTAEDQLSSSVESCIETSDTLLGVLDELRVKGGRMSRFTEAAKRAFSNESKRNEVIQLHERLGELENSTMLRIVVAIREGQSAISMAVESLKISNIQLQANTIKKLDLIHQNLKNLSEKIPFERLNQALEHAVGVESVVRELRNAWPKDLQLSALGEETVNVRKQQKLLRSLQFPEMRARHNSIKEAHPKTFEWALEHKAYGFRRWLEAGEGIYWVGGKAGSGKSTLMRLLTEKPEVTEILTEWAGGRTLVTASHFFWSAGSPIQKSREGLFRTFLFQILREIPDLIKSLFPSRWNGVTGYLEPWSEKELLQALKRLPLESSLPLRCCFFVDGLDEYTAGAKQYHGDFQELIEFLEALSASSVVKICASSRPWAAFGRAFNDSPNQLRLEDLTKGDIENYVASKFRTNQHFQALARDDYRCRKLSDSIVQKAQGVFLWVYLVVDSLLRGASAEDNFYDLQMRLNEIPAGLEDYFKYIIEKIEPVYWKDALCIIRFTIDAEQPLPLLAYHFLDRFLPDHNTNPSTEPCSSQDIDELEKKSKTRLNARCKDFLEVLYDRDDTDSFITSSRIDFLHRTVRDFFLDGDLLDNMMNERKVEFDSSMSLSKVMLTLMKTLHLLPNGVPSHMFSRFEDSLMYYVHRIEQEIMIGQKQEADRLDMAHALVDEFGKIGSGDPSGLYSEGGTILAYAIYARLLLYVAAKLDADPEIIRIKWKRPILDYALHPSALTRPGDITLHEGPYLPLVELLLSKGADPNEILYHGNKRSTVWVLFLIDRRNTPLMCLYEIMKLMISKGANCKHPYFRGFGGFDDVCLRSGLSSLQIQSLRGVAESNKVGPSLKVELWRRLGGWFSSVSILLLRVIAATIGYEIRVIIRLLSWALGMVPWTIRGFAGAIIGFGGYELNRYLDAVLRRNY